MSTAVRERSAGDTARIGKTDPRIYLRDRRRQQTHKERGTYKYCTEIDVH